MNRFLLVLGVLTLLLTSAYGQKLSPRESLAGGSPVYSPKARPYGQSQAQWLEGIWRWTTAVTADRSPHLDPDGRFCHEGQSGPVFYLSSVFIPPGGDYIRSCTIPSNVAIFLPVTATFCSPFTDGTANPEESEQCARAFTDAAIDIAVDIDGVPIDWQEFRATTGPFDIEVTANSVFGNADPFIIEDAVADGYSIMLPPLSVGMHTLHVHGNNSIPVVNFPWDVTFLLTVEPAKGAPGMEILRQKMKIAY